ncbi:MAG: exo-alpha-sialidase [Acidobacteria bacterium]|nr:exo-alpha-sialidase [Acidobacteriota bacterium]
MILTRRQLPALLLKPQDPAPVILRPAPENEASLVTLPNGAVRLFYMKRGEAVCSIDTTNDGATWTEERREFAVPSPTAHACVALLDSRRELHVFFLVIRGTGTKLNIDRFIDIWHATTSNGQWQSPHRIYEGYCGSLRAAIETRRGRIIVPFAAWIAGRAAAPPFGSNEVTAVYSDDRGATWQLSPSRLTSPCREDYNGSNYGAVEPTIVELPDTRLWMLIRTQTDRLYQSFSNDGIEWSPATPANFWSSNSPAALLRLRNNSILLAWNNCLPPPKHEGQGVYGGRDALHLAISSDNAKTWRGFREVYLDPTRNETPPQRGDRATAYPFLTETNSGHIVLVTGQGERRRAIIRLRPDWITARQHESHSDDWSTFESFGPAKGYWRDRRPGPATTWNFPALRAGRLHIEGNGEAQLTLTDHFRDPAERFPGCVTCNISMPITVEWDERGLRAPQRIAFTQAPLHGISYVRLHPRGDDPFHITKIRASAR